MLHGTVLCQLVLEPQYGCDESTSPVLVYDYMPALAVSLGLSLLYLLWEYFILFTPSSESHRIAWVGKDIKNHLVPPPPTMGRVANH